MPLLDIAISQPCSCFRNNILAFRSETHFRSKFVIGNDRGLGLASAFSRKSLYTSKKFDKSCVFDRVEVWHGGLKIEAVATLEIARVSRKIEGVNGHKNVLGMDTDSVTSNSRLLESQYSDEDSIEVDEREKLRRMRISKANKGNTPWNKGRKHSPETLQRIKERTRLAMQDPKVKKKLINLGHAQSEETRVKIGVGVRLGWERRRERLMVQETCHYEWQNLIAVAARKGLIGEEELQWDSYKVLSKEIEKEWLQSIEHRKHTPKPKGSKRAPKSAEQKRKISAAIAAKWADPEYRDRVCSGLMKFHGIAERVERKPKRKPSGNGQARKSPKKKDEVDGPTKRELKSQNQKNRVRRSRTPSYKDPLASSKLEMLKNIRAQRAAAMNKRTEAIFRAKLLIAEAEKAAEALELAAPNNPLAQASLEESRALISEAIQFIESTENEDQAAFENDDLSEIPSEPLPLTEKETDAFPEDLECVNHIKVNGFHRSSASDNEDESSIFDSFDLSDLVNGNASNSGYGDLLEAEEELQERISNGVLETVEELQPTTSNGFQSPILNNTANDSSFTMRTVDQKPSSNGSVEHVQKPLVNGLTFESEDAEAPVKQVNRVKKWVRGRLVEVEEET